MSTATNAAHKAMAKSVTDQRRTLSEGPCVEDVAERLQERGPERFRLGELDMLRIWWPWDDVRESSPPLSHIVPLTQSCNSVTATAT